MVSQIAEGVGGARVGGSRFVVDLSRNHQRITCQVQDTLDEREQRQDTIESTEVILGRCV